MSRQTSIIISKKFQIATLVSFAFFAAPCFGITLRVGFLGPGAELFVDFFEADISFAKSGPGDAKLVLLNLKGTELLNILEDDYNQGLAGDWKPSPFKLDQQGLTLTIKGSSIEAEKDYQILVEITEAQNHSLLKKFITL